MGTVARVGGLVFAILSLATVVAPVSAPAAAQTTSAPTAPVGVPAASDTPYLDAIAEALRVTSPAQEGTLWQVTHDNEFASDADWIMQSPDCWGTRDCAERQGSARFLRQMEDDIAAAEVVVDITTLNPLPTKGFLDAIANGLRRALEAGRDPVVRMLSGLYPFGDSLAQPLADFAVVSPRGYLNDLVKKVGPAGDDLRIIVARTYSNFLTSWNHSKILAVDGKTVIYGGHNQWGGGYLRSPAPVHDLSARFAGPAAHHAQSFVDQLWDYFCPLGGRKTKAARNNLEACPTGLTPPDSPGAGSTPILSVGNLGIDIDMAQPLRWWKAFLHSFRDRASCPFFPDLINAAGVGYDHMNPEEEAMRALVRAARDQVFISQQDLVFFCPLTARYDRRMFEAIGERLLADVRVRIVVSTPGATAGGTTYSNISSLGEITRELLPVVTRLAGGDDEIARASMCANLQLAEFRFGPDDRWPNGEKIANHAKAIAVDDAALSINSDNIYPSWLQEYGQVIEDPQIMAEWNANYADPAWQWSRRTAIVDADQNRCDI